MFESNFLAVQWFGLISLMIVMKEFVSLIMIVMERGKRQFSTYHSNGCLEEKCLIKSMNLMKRIT